jgi:hypothetical protein
MTTILFFFWDGFGGEGGATLVGAWSDLEHIYADRQTAAIYADRGTQSLFADRQTAITKADRTTQRVEADR